MYSDLPLPIPLHIIRIQNLIKPLLHFLSSLISFKKAQFKMGEMGLTSFSASFNLAT